MNEKDRLKNKNANDEIKNPSEKNVPVRIKCKVKKVQKDEASQSLNSQSNLEEADKPKEIETEDELLHTNELKNLLKNNSSKQKETDEEKKIQTEDNFSYIDETENQTENTLSESKETYIQSEPETVITDVLIPQIQQNQTYQQYPPQYQQNQPYQQYPPQYQQNQPYQQYPPQYQQNQPYQQYPSQYQRNQPYQQYPPQYQQKQPYHQNQTTKPNKTHLQETEKQNKSNESYLTKSQQKQKAQQELWKEEANKEVKRQNQTISNMTAILGFMGAAIFILLVVLSIKSCSGSTEKNKNSTSEQNYSGSYSTYDDYDNYSRKDYSKKDYYIEDKIVGDDISVTINKVYTKKEYGFVTVIVDCNIYNNSGSTLEFFAYRYFKLNNDGIIKTGYSSDYNYTELAAGATMQTSIKFMYSENANTNFNKMTLTIDGIDVKVANKPN